MFRFLLYFRSPLCSLSSRVTTFAVQYIARSYMHVKASDPAPFHPCESRAQFPHFPSVRILFDCTRAAVHHSLLRLLSSPCALPASGVVYVPLSSCAPCECPCAFGRLPPRARCVCVPCRTHPVFSLFFISFRPHPHCAPLRVPSHRARVLPACRIVCVPTVYVSAASLRALVFHTTSPFSCVAAVT